MSPRVDIDEATAKGFPRVSGDEPFADVPLSREEMFSPRERG